MRAMQKIHQRIEDVVTDPEVAESLKPHYMIGCKRPTFHGERQASHTSAACWARLLS